MRILSLMAALMLYVAVQAQGLETLIEHELDNGLTVVLNPDDTKAEVFGYMVCKAGGKDDPADATGMAHYMEHMMFKGTTQLGTTDWDNEKVHIDSIFMLYDELAKTEDEEARKAIQMQINAQSVKANAYAIPNEFSNLVKQIGGTGLNANTSADRTVYFNTFPPNQMEAWLDLYSHRIQDAVFRGFQSELETVYEEKNMYADMFIMNMLQAFQKSFFKKHPYGQQTLIGTVDDLKNPSLTKMYEFYKNWYVPNNMALVLTGDFDYEEVIPLIEAKFGAWEPQEIPQKKTWEEPAIKGREFAEVNMSPIKMGMLGFQTVPEGHPDEIALQVCNGLLSNQSSSGLLDQLALNNEILAAQVFPLPYYDYGLTVVFVIPKVVGQKLEEAEDLAISVMKKIGAGEFEDWRVDAIKKELYRQYQESQESNEERGIIIGEAFARGDDIMKLKDYPERIKAVSREDIVAVANKYYGDDYLAFYSKMGSATGEKIDKPGYKPVVSNTTAKSPYAKHFAQIEPTPYNPMYLDFDKDVDRAQLAENCKLFVNDNPLNDVFSLTISFNVGETTLPLIDEATMMMDYAYVEGYNKSELKSAFARLGATSYFGSDESYTYVDLYGLEDQLDSSLILLNKLINQPIIAQEDMKSLIDGAEAERKLEREDVSSVSSAAFAYVKYGEKCSTLDRLTVKELKAMNSSTLTDEFAKATAYEIELHYAGKKSIEEVQQSIDKHLKVKADLKKGVGYQNLPLNKYTEDVVYFVNKKKANQSEIYFFANTPAYTVEEYSAREAFNLYFGGDFTGLVLQEIREYRSLAYGAGANFSMPDELGQASYFSGYIGTQADKTAKAIQVFRHLTDSMPVKEERLDMMRSYLAQSIFTERPSFRNLSLYIEDLKDIGISDDPARLYTDDYLNLEFVTITDFYEKRLQNAPMVTLVVGDKKKIDMDELKKYGRIIEIKEKALYSK